MLTKLIALPFFLLMIAQTATAQPRSRVSESVQNKKAPTPRNVSTIFSPAILSAPLPYIGAQAGVQYQGRQWAGLVELAMPVHRRNDFTDVKYFRAGAELKKYFHSKPHIDDYISLHTSYAYRSFVNPNGGSYLMRGSTDDYNYTSATIVSPALTATIRIGQQFRLGRNGWIDLFAGGGIRTLFTSYRNVQGLTVNTGFTDGIPQQYMYNFTSTSPTIDLGLRIGFRLSQELED